VRERGRVRTHKSERASERARDVTSYSRSLQRKCGILRVCPHASSIIVRAHVALPGCSIYICPHTTIHVSYVLESYSEGDGKDGVGADVGLVGRPVHLVHLCEEIRLD
jgi:hypothetical protein